jgi:hypothetical protein
MLGRVLVELQQHVGVVDDLGHRLGVLGAVVDLEGLDRDLSLVDILGVIDRPCMSFLEEPVGQSN